MQRDLFDDAPALTAPIAHAADPPTSHEAAERHTESGARAAHARMVLDMVRRRPGCTAVELWEGANEYQRFRLCEMQEVRRRLTDLLHDRLVRQGGQRPCRVKGSTMVVWFVRDEAE